MLSCIDSTILLRKKTFGADVLNEIPIVVNSNTIVSSGSNAKLSGLNVTEVVSDGSRVRNIRPLSFSE